MTTLHTIQGTIDNATNITEAISMLTSVYKETTKLSIEYKEVTTTKPVLFAIEYVTKGFYEFTLEYKEDNL